jgi:hypothetical protein
MDSASWQLTKGNETKGKWTFVDSACEGSGSWIVHNRALGNFVLEGEFLYNGSSQGGVVIRGDGQSNFPWLSGYKMDIDADMPGSGHIHFPYRPQPNPGVVPFPVGKWQLFSIRSAGPDITVSLNHKEVLRFTDDHFRYGVICLEGEKGGMRYRNLRIQQLDKEAPKGPRSSWVEAFDGSSGAGLLTKGSVVFSNGAMEMDANSGHAELSLKDVVLKNGMVEIEAWCQRNDRAAYRVALRADSNHAGSSFTCKTTRIAFNGTGQCTSEFPMFTEVRGTEFWRFSLDGTKVEAWRFGQKVITCIDTPVTKGTVTISADSCLLIVRGIRYRQNEMTDKKAK